MNGPHKNYISRNCVFTHPHKRVKTFKKQCVNRMFLIKTFGIHKLLKTFINSALLTN
jgi:hypothetical protein